jgi:hypothetical protein
MALLLILWKFTSKNFFAVAFLKGGGRWVGSLSEKATVFFISGLQASIQKFRK